MLPIPKSISFVIPTFNEEEQIAETLERLKTQIPGPDVEVIVADGGSRDGTVQVAAGFESIQTIVCQRANRGWQMNKGAQFATGDVLLFLHADVKLPQDALTVVRDALADENVIGGCFQIRFSDQVPASLKLVGWGINLRTRLFSSATGDQCIFVRRHVFEQIGGYQTFPLMEDIALFNRMKRYGQVIVLNKRVEISPRRWLKHGIWRTVLLMYLLRVGYWLGIHPATLKRFFIDVR